MRPFRALPLVLLPLLPACASGQAAAARPAAHPFPRADTAALRHTLDSLADAHHGTVGYTVHNIDTGERLERRGDETFPTASLIKVPILVTAFLLADSGRLSLDDRIHVLKVDKVPGSGVLQFFHDGIDITVGDAAWFMITVSDNTATNLLLDKIGIRTVWTTMERLGLPHSKVHAKSFRRSTSVAMDSSVKYGLGVTTPNEMARLFELLARGEAVSPAADSAMLEILEHNEDRQMLYRYAGGVRAARKTGATDSVRTECGLFHLSGRVVACVLTKENQDTRWVLDNEPQVTMARMGEAIVRAWARGDAAR